MKKVMKIVGATLLIVLCLAMTGFAGYFLWSARPRAKSEPETLTMDPFLEEQPQEQPPLELPEQEEKPEEDPTEEPDQPEPPAEETPAEPEPLPEAPEVTDAREKAQAYLETMTLEEKLWQLMIVTPEQLTGSAQAVQAGDLTKTALGKMKVGGIVYFAGNLLSEQQTRDMLWATQTMSKTPLFLAVDEEGGRVSRVGSNAEMNATQFQAAAVYGEQGDPQAVEEVGRTMGRELRNLGFNVDFAPVADVITNPNNTEIGDRSYSSDPQVAASMVSAMVEGLQDSGMAACLKHFPGHGSTEADSHEGTSVSNRTVEELRATEWVPFQAGIDQGVEMVMVGHQTNPNLSQLPASLSPVVMTYLRQELGFDGLIITDSLRMGAIKGSYTSAQAAVMAIQAGADLLLMPNDLPTAYQGLADALLKGDITEARIDQSVLRILTAKYELGIMW